MKHILIALLLAVSITIQAQHTDSLITKESLYKNVSFLAGDSLKGRMTGSTGMAIAANYISSYFKQHGVNSINAFPDYYDRFFVSSKITGINVVGAVPGYGSDSLIIVSAHYDHIGQGTNRLTQKGIAHGDDIYNGANDNATGTAAMMELAKYYAASKTNYYTVIFVAFAAEELGMLGSAHFIKNMDNPGLIKAAVNLEMLGRPIDGAHCFYTGFVSTKTVRAINKTVNEKTGFDKFLTADPFPEHHLDMRSDHYPIAKMVKPSFTIMASSPDDEHYHSITDETPTIDFDFLYSAVKNIALVLQYFNK